jgi:predicted negative regulator of RcsB-dependent stress response
LTEENEESNVDPNSEWVKWSEDHCFAKLKENPQNCYALLKLGQIYVQDKKLNECQDVINKIEKIDHNFEKALVLELLGDLTLRKEDKQT